MFYLTREFAKVRYAELLREAENYRLHKRATAGRPRSQERFLLRIGDALGSLTVRRARVQRATTRR